MQLGATHLRRILPKLTAAAGAIGPAKVLVMGLGVAGLEALATAHRLGAVTEGYDVRSETQEQALSLGATFVQTGVDARGKGGYERELIPDEKTKVAAVLTKHIQAADLIITTAAIPGRPSPKLISTAQVAGMKAGSVIVDLSAEGGGNCEDTRRGETAEIGAVTIVAPFNVPAAVLVGLSLKMANTWEKFVILRAEKLQGVKGPGMFLMIPIIDQVIAVIDERIQTTAFNAESALTKYTVPVNVDAIIFWHVHDAEAAALKFTNYR